MRFKKNKCMFLKLCCVCNEQFTNEEEWLTHRKTCKGAKALSMPKKYENTNQKVDGLKKYDNAKIESKKEEVSNIVKDEDVANDLKALDSITQNDIDIIEEVTEEVDEESIELDDVLDDIKDEEPQLEESVESVELEESKETDLTEILPEEVKKVTVPRKNGRRMKRTKTVKKD